jgi:hypothetical protein
VANAPPATEAAKPSPASIASSQLKTLLAVKGGRRTTTRERPYRAGSADQRPETTALHLGQTHAWISMIDEHGIGRRGAADASQEPEELVSTGLMLGEAAQ